MQNSVSETTKDNGAIHASLRIGQVSGFFRDCDWSRRLSGTITAAAAMSSSQHDTSKCPYSPCLSLLDA